MKPTRNQLTAHLMLSIRGAVGGVAILLFPISFPLLYAFNAGRATISHMTLAECIKVFGKGGVTNDAIVLLVVLYSVVSFFALAVLPNQHPLQLFGVLVVIVLWATPLGYLCGLPFGIADRVQRSRASEKAAKQEAEPPTFHVPLDLKERLMATIRGQDLALEELSQALLGSVRKYERGQALGMYLLVGATGSGKTETAKRLAAILGWPMHREECNQYHTQYSAQRLIGSTLGYLDSERGGSLTNALMASRHGVLLLDEIEKAHPSVAQMLMTLADEGLITTGMGQTVDARGWLILATSNASQAEIIRMIEDPDLDRFSRLAAIKQKLTEHWAPEIIGRLRSIMPYRPIAEDVMRKIFVDMLTEQVSLAGGTPAHSVQIEDSAIELLARAYKSLRQFGVREMRSVASRDLTLPLQRLMDGPELDLVIAAEGDRLVAMAKQGGRKKLPPTRGLFSWLGVR